MTDAKQNNNKSKSDKNNVVKKKKERLILRVFKWIGKGFLALLLILSVIFQAPWKVITLLAIFFFACFVLPIRMRKWFWLVVGVVVLIILIWIFSPEDNTGWRPYTFDKELAAFETKYTVADEENAAFVYDAIFETLDTDSNQPEFFLESTPSSINETWLSKNHPEMSEWLKGHQDTIAKLMQAAKKEKCHFSIPANSWDIGQHMERLSPMRRCAFLLVSAANNDIAEGRIDDGLEKYLCILRMADHMYQHPVTIDFLVGSALESLALTRLNRFIIESEPTINQLRIIINASGDPENKWSSVFKKILEPDKLIAKNTFCSLVYEVNPEGKVRFSRNPNAVFETAFPNEISKPNYLQKKLYKAKSIFTWLGMPPTPHKAGEIFDNSFDIYDAMTEPDFNWPNQSQGSGSPLTKKYLYRIGLNLRYIAQMMACLSEESYYSLHDTYLRALTLRRGSSLVIAIRQYKNEHGKWPDSLDDIKSAAPAEAFIDPITGNPLEYENHGEKFSLSGKSINIWPQ